MSKEYTREEWQRRKNLAPAEGKWTALPVVKQGKGRNGEKKQRRKEFVGDFSRAVETRAG